MLCVSCLIERLALLFSFIIFAIYCMAGMDLTSMNLDSARYAIHLLYLMAVEGSRGAKQRDVRLNIRQDIAPVTNHLMKHPLRKIQLHFCLC